MPGSPKGKKKLSKTEKEKLKLEEEEQKRLEEEEENRKKLEAASEKAAQEKLQAVEKKKLEVEESKRRYTELADLNEYINTHEGLIEITELRLYKESLWERYMRCDGSPDPSVMAEINTYINLELESNNTNKDVQDILNENKLTLNLIEELEGKLRDTPAGLLTEVERQSYNSTLLGLQKLVKRKCDIASHKALLRATDLMNSETLNLQKLYLSDQSRLYLWGNLSKNPRIKQFEFENSAVGFEIPKMLTLSDCVYRMLITEFDHLSHTSKSFYPCVKVPEAPEEPVKETEGDKEEKEEEEDKEKEKSDLEKEPEEEVDIMAMLDNPDGEEQEKEVDEEPQEIPDDLVKTPDIIDYEEFDGDKDAVDLRAYNSIGGVMYFNLLHMPPQPKLAGAWNITQIDDPAEISYFDYAADEVDGQPQTPKTGAAAEEEGEVKKEERPMIQAMVRLPQNVYFCEEPQVARWEEKHKQWRQDGFKDIQYVDETRRFSFKTNQFGTFCLLQDTHGNMPFQSWEIRPLAQDHCLLTLLAAIVEIQIQVKGDKLMLVQPKEPPELEGLRNKWLPFDIFKRAMVASGLNIFPNVDSHKYVVTQDKNSLVETRLYKQMALSLSAMGFAWSKWNAESTPDRVIVLGTEKLDDTSIPEDNWTVYSVNRRRVLKLTMSEFDEKFSEESDPNTLVHADMYHMAAEVCSPEGQSRIKATDYQFVHTVNKLIHSTRLLVFS